MGGFAIYLHSNLVSWFAQKQKTFLRSSTEFEYKALADTVAELTWIETLLGELHVIMPIVPNLWVPHTCLLILCSTSEKNM